MKRLKRHRGVTLVEVLVSLILIGVIAAGFLTFFSGSFNNILRQRSQNAINFDIQESFEKQLAESKKHEGTGTDIETFTYQIGNGTKQSIDVKGTNLSYNDKIKKIHLFAANAIETPLGIPDMKVSIPGGKRYYYAGKGITTPGGKVDTADIQKKSKARIYTESGWFLSDRSIGTSSSGIVPVGTIGKTGDGTVSQLVLPEMPTDFQPLSKLETGIYITDDMRGKYLTFAARAINSYGRVGNYQEADRIWIMGLPVTQNVRLHTDADLALLKNRNSTAIIPTDNQPHTNTEVRDYFNDVAYGATIPVLNYKEPAINQARQLIALDGRTMQFSNHNFNNGYTTSVLIGNRQQTGPLLTYKLDNTLTWGINLENDGRIAIKTVDTTTANNGGQEYIQNVKLDYSNDNSIQVRSAAKNGSLGIEIFINGQSVYNKTVSLTRNRTTHNISSGQIIFGGNTYINEFAVYTESLNNSNIQKLAEYFRDKYKASQ